MAIYVLGESEISPVESKTFAQLGLEERRDLQALLKNNPEVIVSEDILIVAEEFSDWEDSRRRIDLLAIDKAANPVVIELKRTESGGHMELQAIRYAAMVSTMTFDALVATYGRYLKANGQEDVDARAKLYDFLDWESEEAMGQDVKIVLASAEFSKELTTSVIWLNDRDLDIRCVRMRPYNNDGQVLLEVETIIPLRETQEYQVRLREKAQDERVARESARDYSKFDVMVNGIEHRKQNKRELMRLLVSAAFKHGAGPQQVSKAVGQTKLRAFRGELDPIDIREQLEREDPGGTVPRVKRFFCDDPFHFEGHTYVLSNQWGVDTLDAARALCEAFPGIEFKAVGD